MAGLMVAIHQLSWARSANASMRVLALSVYLCSRLASIGLRKRLRGGTDR